VQAHSKCVVIIIIISIIIIVIVIVIVIIIIFVVVTIIIVILTIVIIIIINTIIQILPLPHTVWGLLPGFFFQAILGKTRKRCGKPWKAHHLCATTEVAFQ
jgi:prepilin signal peptidase PulO-like enzyme (type II secretory pathway)